MATSSHFRHNVRSEQNLYEDLIVESLKFYGVDIYYMPREVVHRDMVFNDETLSRFAHAYRVEVYIDNVEGFDGAGDLFQKFGVEIRDAVTLTMARRRWNNEIRKYQREVDKDVYYRPREGDLIHLPLSQQTFEIQRVSDEDPFYQLGKLPVFKLRCELFEYSNEDFDTNVPEIDQIEQFQSYQWELTMNMDSSAEPRYLRGDNVTQSFDTYDVTGEVVHWCDSNQTLRLTNVGNTTGEYKSFVTDRIVLGENGANGYPTLISELQNIQQGSPGGSNAAVVDFDVSSFEFVDFSESNPFGEFQ